jgi:hypothetical protein
MSRKTKTTRAKVARLTYGQVAFLLARILSKVWKTPVTVKFEERNTRLRILDAREQTDAHATDYSFVVNVIG